ncbi:MAG: flagellar hook capping protein [Lachnospiraceae bacterium]|nr:flagellar hook capping protein [Lachnospiraceae bacterium]
MSSIASVVDGKIIDSTASSVSLSSEKTSDGGALDKDAFLQLLVAEMQNQDPLQPTTNTEYISQFAQFSSLEAMQNVSSSVDMSRAQEIVGKEVFLNVTDTSGNTTEIYGRVDYVVMEAGDVFVSVNDNLYAFEDVTTVLDESYWEAYNLGYEWTSALQQLPNLNKLTLASRAAIEKLRDVYDKMSAYQKTFIASSSLDLLKSYETKISELEKLSNNGNEEPDTVGKNETIGKKDEVSEGSEEV